MHAGGSIGGADETKDIKTKVIRWLIREYMGVVFVGLLLLIPAGTVAWGWGWALVGLYAVWVTANAAILIPTNPELIAERIERGRAGTKSWDTVLMSVVGLLTLGKYVVAGLDYRHGWTGIEVAVWLRVLALAVSAAGYALGTWSMAANAYFSMIVRIQDDRGQTVTTGGPYRFVRHPGYAGTILFELAVPFMLGTLWALIPGVLNAVLMIVRTGLEDRTLQKELAGYEDFTRQTRYRLLPGIW